MAEVWETLSTVRISLSDPQSVIALATYADKDSFPTSAVSQTAYRAEDTGIYYTYDSDLEEWESVDLLISDDRLNNLITLYGQDKATQRAITIIIAGLYGKLNFTKSNVGAETTEYQTLNDTIAYYKALRDQYKEEEAETSATNTGLIISMPESPVGGFFE